MDPLRSLGLLRLILLSAACASGAIRYVDSAATGANNGTSWTDAWTSLSAINGLAPGDTVYISGGSTNKVYNMGNWLPTSGNSSAQVTYTIGRDAGHNGTAIFRNNVNANSWIYGHWGQQRGNYITVDGRLNNANHFRVEDYALVAYMDQSSGPPGTPGFTGVKLLGITAKNGGIRMYDSRKVELGWLVFEPALGRSGFAVIFGIGRGYNGGTYGDSSIHDCEINLFYRHGVDANGNNGGDALQWIDGCDIYNNRVISHFTSGAVDANHQDGLQTGGNFIRVYNNYWRNLANYVIYLETWGGGTPSNVQIWNNVFHYSDPVLTSQPSQAIAIGNNGGGAHYRNYQIFNNTFYGGKAAIQFGDTSTTIENSCRIVNNLTTGTGHNFLGTNQAVVSNNVTLPADQYVNQAGGDFHLKPTATAAIDKGTSAFVSTITTRDKDGVTRPQGAAWDIGAYEFAASTPTPTPTPTPEPTPPAPPPSAGSYRCPPGDLNRDGRDDIFWRNSATGEVWTWLMSGSTMLPSSGQTPYSTAGYRVFGFEDIDGDFKSDIVWVDDTGTTAIAWLMTGKDVRMMFNLPRPGTAYTLAAFADLNADARAELVWRDAATGLVVIYRGNGLGPNGVTWTPAYQRSVGKEWSLVASADIDGNRKAELLWRSAGGFSAWMFKGMTPVRFVNFPAVSSPWSLAAVGEIYGDLKQDLVWYNADTGQLRAWVMRGADPPISMNLPVAASPWSVAGVFQLGITRHGQIILTNANSGEIALWTVTAPNQVQSGRLPYSFGSNWSIQPR
jgi:hypothetical protein